MVFRCHKFQCTVRFQSLLKFTKFSVYHHEDDRRFRVYTDLVNNFSVRGSFRIHPCLSGDHDLKHLFIHKTDLLFTASFILL